MDKYFYVLLAFYIWLLPTETDSKQVEGELTENGKVNMMAMIVEMCVVI